MCNTAGYKGIQTKAATQEEHTRAWYRRVYRTDTELCSDNIQFNSTVLGKYVYWLYSIVYVLGKGK